MQNIGEELLASIRVARARATETEQSKNHAHLTANGCSLSDQDLLKWQAMYDALKQEPAAVKARRQAVLACPLPLDEDEVADLELMPIRNAPQQPEIKPQWVPPVSNLREQLRTSVLIFMVPG